MAVLNAHSAGTRYLRFFNDLTLEFQSICRICARTVGVSSTESELSDREYQHICDGSIILDFVSTRRKRETPPLVR
ncbi:hypothetical protein HNQ77_001031 [Silvibacterium bohemicum]|uniref:Uncharacterized protein n=1 Tax=Silvibacterium bohemicum TaxID=1577686 RepID=A0A841JRD1_9BACT|nr:hypothetical protein [Silvibacterium bohemicum]